MLTYLVSDLHLTDKNEAFLFNQEKEVSFCRLCEIVEETDGQLVLAGDIFDFTGMTPCHFGQLEFFQEAVPHELLNSTLILEKSKVRSTLELLKSIQNVFPNFFRSLANLARAKKLIYIPGNHDCDFLNPKSREDFLNLLGVPHQSIHWTRYFTVKESLVVVHGNEFDAPNITRTSCQNPGFVFTSALYQSVLPALQMLGVEQKVLDAIPAVRPEEETVIGLENYLGPETCRRVLTAFVRLLQRNGYFRGLPSLPGWFLGHDFPVISALVRRGVTPQRIRSLLPKEEELMANARKGSKTVRSKMKRQNPLYEKAIVVMGHTHELDHHGLYVNLGTWNDHIRGLDPEDLKQPEIALPVFVFEKDGDGYLFNVRPLKPNTSFFECPLLASIKKYEVFEELT